MQTIKCGQIIIVAQIYRVWGSQDIVDSLHLPGTEGRGGSYMGSAQGRGLDPAGTQPFFSQRLSPPKPRWEPDPPRLPLAHNCQVQQSGCTVREPALIRGKGREHSTAREPGTECKAA